MQKLIKLAIVACATFCATAMAAPVSLGSIEHLYGTADGRQASSISSIYHHGGNCDTTNATSITVKATSAASCNRFADAFDFSSIGFDTIDHFSLTLTFANARDQSAFFGLSQERWNVRGASNYVQSALNFGDTLNASGPQTFIFDSSKALFNDIVNAQEFFLSFSTSFGSAANFNLSSAKLELFGTALVAEVPEPASLALVAVSLLALGGVRRSRKKAAV